MKFGPCMKPCERRKLLYVRAGPDEYMGYWLFLVPAVFQLFGLVTTKSSVMWKSRNVRFEPTTAASKYLSYVAVDVSLSPIEFCVLRIARITPGKVQRNQGLPRTRLSNSDLFAVVVQYFCVASYRRDSRRKSSFGLIFAACCFPP